MALRIVTRGPDDAGEWCDESAGIALGHRRLSIVDLSPAGHQPMESASGRWIVAFNGEIYNHNDLRLELRDSAWRGRSDTETLLAGFDAWGVARTIERCVGMFALAVWDRQERALTLIRDRFGEKPLYYGWRGGDFVFASELKALREHRSWTGEIDREALAEYMRYGCVPAPFSIYAGIRKLMPGSMLRLTNPAPADLAPEAYWSLPEVVAQGAEHPWSGGDREAVDELERLLRRSVAGQMIADVPVGAFLSGGVDSSTVVSLMQAQTAGRPACTFSIGFDEEQYNEAKQAAEVARHLGTDHTELSVSPQEARSVVPCLPEIYDEPFADSSQIPTYLVARLARTKVTVALSGDAGDELFGGYNRYFVGARVWRRLSRIPRPLRKAVSSSIRLLSPESWDRLYRIASPVLPAPMRVRLPGEKLHKAAKALEARSDSDLYRRLVTQWEPAEVVRGFASEGLDLFPHWSGLRTLPEQMMAWDAVGYLPNDILTKVDRAAMAVSLETRIPLLDHRIAEFAWQLPLRLKLRDGQGKWILRQLLARYVPPQLTERPKMGFGVPIDAWLRGPLRNWAEDLLTEQSLRAGGFFDVSRVRAVWQDHLSGRANTQHQIWAVLMFQAWLHAETHG